MLDDEFLKERANIRAKMLKFSRAVNEGKRTDEILAPDEIAKPSKSDDVLKKRLEKGKKPVINLNEKKDKIYIKEDLIDVKLEERKSFTEQLFAKFKKKKTSPKPSNVKSNETKVKDILPEKKQAVKLAVYDEVQNTPKPKPQSLTQTKPINQVPQIKTENTAEQVVEEDNVKVKNVLLQGHSKATQDEKNLGKNQLLFAALCIIFAVVVFVPKIYITSNIYYLSRDIASLRTQESVLSEENKELSKKLENMRFQNQILDYLE